VRKLRLDRRREQSLVDADVDEARLQKLRVAFVRDLLVVQAPGVLADGLVGVVADRVALERVGLEVGDGAVDRLATPAARA